MRYIARVSLLACCLLIAAPAPADDFALRDGDTVVFLGDSITAARTYGKIIETYTLLRYPDRRVRFINAGHGGDTAAGGLARLERDVFQAGATVLTVAYGVNDIGWGAKADDEHKQQYLDGIRGIVEQCRAHNVRVFICSAAITAQDPDKSAHDFLQTMCDEGLALAAELGAGTIDLQRGMRVIQRRVWAANAAATAEKDKATLHAPDGIHLNDLGQLAIAFVILKGLGAPADVSAVTIDAAHGTLVEARGCRVDNIRASDGVVEFDRLDAGLPLNLLPLWGLQFRFIPIPDELNRYLLTVSGLPADRYELRVSERLVGTFTADELARGVNLASATPNPWEPGGPWNAQAILVHHLTEARNELALMRSLGHAYLPSQPQAGPLDAQANDLNERLEALQRATARPVTYHFVLRPSAP